jgi:hypothetical protein
MAAGAFTKACGSLRGLDRADLLFGSHSFERYSLSFHGLWTSPILALGWTVFSFGAGWYSVLDHDGFSSLVKISLRISFVLGSGPKSSLGWILLSNIFD